MATIPALPIKATFKASAFHVTPSDNTSDTSTFTLTSNTWTILNNDDTTFESGQGVSNSTDHTTSYSNNKEMVPLTPYKVKVEYASTGASAGTSPIEPFTTTLSIGDPYEGGYYAGIIKETSESGKQYYLIVAPRIGGQYGASELIAGEALYFGDGEVEVRKTLTNGPAATTAMIVANSPTVKFQAAAFAERARTLNSVGLNGKTDWYVPARDELELLYRAFKPNNAANSAGNRSAGFGTGGDGLGVGININSIPEGKVYTGTHPLQTTISRFQTNIGTGEGFLAEYYWSITEGGSNTAWRQHFNSGAQDPYDAPHDAYLRLVRRVPVPV